MEEEATQPDEVVCLCASDRPVPLRAGRRRLLREEQHRAAMGVEARMSDYLSPVMRAPFVVVVHNIMLTNYLRQIVRIQPFRATFATAVTRDQVDYYSALEVDSGATEQAIRAAYAELTNGINPKADSTRFKQLNEAFVILTDSKTRDAYDSLLKVRKSYYLSPEDETVPATRSYLAQRRAQK